MSPIPKLFLFFTFLFSVNGLSSETVDVQGHPSLRDLQAKAICRWKKAEDLRDQLTALPQILEVLHQTHWYLAYLLRHEAVNLSICWSNSALKPIETDDQDSVAQFQLNTKQVAVRINNDIYIDKVLFDAMSPRDQAYLYIHEVLHSFLPMGISQRNNKLRSMVASIQENELAPMIPRDFSYQIKMNELHVRADLAALSGGQDDLLKALDKNLDLDTKKAAAYRALNPFATSPEFRKRKSDNEAFSRGYYNRNKYCDLACLLAEPLNLLTDDLNTLSHLYLEFVNDALTSIEKNNSPRFAEILNGGFDVNGYYDKQFYGANGQKTAFEWAFASNANNILEMIIHSPQFDPNRPTHIDPYYGDRLPIYLCLGSKNDFALAELLKLPSLKLNDVWGSAIGLAITKKHKFAVEQLLSRPEADLKVNIQPDNDTYFNPLMYAIQYSTTEIARLFLAPEMLLKYDINTKSQAKLNFGETALIVAAWTKNKEIVAELLKIPGIDVNAISMRELSDLKACGFSFPSLYSCDYRIVGHSALMIAAAKGQLEIVNLLLQNTSLDVLQKNTSTTLLIDRYSGSTEKVEKYFTAKDLAYAADHTSIFAILNKAEQNQQSRNNRIDKGF